MIKHPCFNNDGELINKFVKYFEYDINENKDPPFKIFISYYNDS